MKSRIFTTLLAIAVLTALFAPVSIAQDATTPAKKAQPDRTAPPSGMKAATASEDPSKQPPSCAASVNASRESHADDLLAENRRDNQLFPEEQPLYTNGNCQVSRSTNKLTGWCLRQFPRSMCWRNDPQQCPPGAPARMPSNSTRCQVQTYVDLLRGCFLPF